LFWHSVHSRRDNWNPLCHRLHNGERHAFRARGQKKGISRFQPVVDIVVRAERSFMPRSVTDLRKSPSIGPSPAQAKCARLHVSASLDLRRRSDSSSRS
jgi:hypothetical protein